jgi:hypothetical protein
MAQGFPNVHRKPERVDLRSWKLRRSPADAGFRVRADFEGGNVDAPAVLAPDHVSFAARRHTSPRPLWFSFCLLDARAPAVRCDLRNADQCLGARAGWRTARPVFSADGHTWQRVARTEYVEETPDSGYFRFVVPIVGPRTYVAYCYPYTTAALSALLASVPRRPDLRAGDLCLSAEGRTVPYLRYGDHEAPNASVWVMARQHAGESPASYTMEGLIRFLSGDDPAAGEALAGTAFHLVPMVDPDGVFHGRYGKDEEPIDYNRDWRGHPVRPEVHALVRAMRAAHERHPLGLVLDLHASHHGDTECYLFGQTPDDDPATVQQQERFLRLLAEEGPPGVGFQATDFRPNLRPPRSARDYLWRTLRVPVLTLEMSYHLAQSGEYLTPHHYRDFGGALGRALHRCFQTEPLPAGEGPSIDGGPLIHPQ